MNDPIIDMSPAQKRLRLAKMRAELAELGYSIVETDWLTALIRERRNSEHRRNAKRYWKLPESNERASG